jgi:hypothetical protein
MADGDGDPAGGGDPAGPAGRPGEGAAGEPDPATPERRRGEAEPDPAERDRLLARLAAPAGLCATCVHLRLLASPRSVFVRCGLAATDPAFPRYPALPVTRCAGYRPVADQGGGSQANAKNDDQAQLDR